MKKLFTFVILMAFAAVLVACDPAETPQDTTDPVISGTHDFALNVGDPVPNWLQGVTAEDDVDGPVTVTVDASDVNLALAGTYDLVYSAEDAAGNKASVTVDVVVTAVVLNANIEFGTDPFNGTSATGVAGVGVALYFDATEDDVMVDLEQVEFTVNKPSGVIFDPEIGFVEKLGVYYLRALEPGTYTVTLTVTDSDNLVATRTKDIVVSTGDLSGNVDEIKAAIQAIYPNNAVTNLDYRTSEGVFNEWVVVGKDFTVFQRVDNTGNYATAFIPFAKFEGGQPLGDFTVSFKYTSLNAVWKLLFSAWTGAIGSDNWAGDYWSFEVHDNSIAVIGEADEDPEKGIAQNVPLLTQPVWVKLTRKIEGTTVTFNIFTSLDGVTYTLAGSSVLTEQGTGAGEEAALLTGLLPFSIDNDFIIENFSVSGTVFTLPE